MRTVASLDAKYYPRTYTRAVNSTLALREMVLKRIGPDSRLLDVGAGSGRQYNHKYDAHLTGADISPEVLTNPYLNQAVVADAGSLPFPDESFDGVISDFTFEHLDEPRAAILEAYRVLKPGGFYAVRTVNRRHYVALFARLVPNRLHARVLRKVQQTRDGVDVFPTRYRLNTRRSLVRALEGAGFSVEELRQTEGEPCYFKFSALLYRLGIVYERLANSSEVFAGLRASLILCARK